ncbi:MAG: hypothetical protein ACREF4_18530 [Gammaproteobacteria bacterium]
MSDHRLTRPRTIRRLWRIFIAVLALAALAELAVEAHPHFAAEGLFGGYAIYGFVACAALILVARALGLILKRPDTYYDD